ncbi:MAG: hypothetical protein JOZ02_20405 [Acidobacteria bacterium]|nr:hypothetical protein [Acidobacteriota bacterium]
MPSDYDLRSLNHERRMLAVYRRQAAHDAGALQPLANACWRAGCFEWALYGDAETVRRLWGEAAAALARGFARRQPGFDPSPDQLVLALHFAIAAREREAFNTLAMSAPNLREGALREARAFRSSRAHFHLAEGYALVARALVEQKPNPARAAVASLEAARAESDRGWWERQFPDPLDAAWRVSEHEAVCALLSAVARRVADDKSDEARAEADEATAEEFARTVDETLARLGHFLAHDPDHHPKLYAWLPGLALCALAASAGFPVDWLAERHERGAEGYERLPPELLRRTA